MILHNLPDFLQINIADLFWNHSAHATSLPPVDPQDERGAGKAPMWRMIRMGELGVRAVADTAARETET